MSSEPPNREEPEESERRRLAERLVPELLKRIFEAGVGKISEGPENLRHLVSELRLPKEIGNYVLAQIDETKNGLYRVVAKEIRDFLESTNLSEEITRSLAKMSLEIKTEIRFIPQDGTGKMVAKPDLSRTEVSIGRDKQATEAPREERPRRRSR